MGRPGLPSSLSLAKFRDHIRGRRSIENLIPGLCAADFFLEPHLPLSMDVLMLTEPEIK